MGSNFLFEWGTINQAFAAGQIGMYMSGSDVYNSLVTENEIDPDILRPDDPAPRRRRRPACSAADPSPPSAPTPPTPRRRPA